ncbi:Glutathione transport system permease protein GsiC [Fusobacterium sp. DD29]|jgi:peptide/nickel transport system permease protein|uniref:nickel ABC transporter permease n=1 Tax=unclassified Fusobacterium TaxID=2648384 RepID=UPI001B8D56F5|nr:MULTISPECIES: nickel ABC transporter permease [unclassified Fusobacterium]MBR8701727.1 Glutathione transport system permease protein GsiC [Fusobacterium sp. DD45]MBR8711521.1 Glutathione transport system permease protein GsiC [Fusobacterium sp. DD28]MBR8749898.1 Glutathione transport system permease protein GsiC [Fusobacterium sp. DD29]MBR8752057.1 Glutathione transport system permease protein GsiC [Fusobacterium sp. DD26]MBR8762127.1 Glutathione transport system permease protein GsiC [Fuso
MHKYVIKRLLLLIPVLLGVSLLVFTILSLTPGDPAQLILGESAPREAVLKLREEMGLNDPFLLQYLRFVKNAILGDFGRSYTTGREVFGEIFSRFPNTFVLAVTGMIISICIGIPVGIISATKQYSFLDSFSMVLALLGVSMPVFWLGLMLILVFSVKLGVLPSGGFDGLKSIILPAMTLGVGSAAIITRMTRSSMLEVIRQDYIRTARAKGVAEKVVINRHALKNALIPIITVVGLQFGGLLGGAVLTESVYSWPGVGRLMVDAIRQKDTPTVLAAVVFLAAVFSVVNLLVDILYAYVDPRIKSQYK